MLDRRGVTTGLIASTIAGQLRAATPDSLEGYAVVPGGKVWWRKVGSGSRTALLTLHGGPGAGHDYLTPLEALANQRPVVLYDQLGCGRSDKPDDPTLWHIDRFCDEIDSLRSQLGLEKVILYGHSWGGWLALEYLARRGAHAAVHGLVLASTSASMKQFVNGADRLLRAMPGGVAMRLKALKAEGKTDSDEYARLVGRFYDAYLINMANPPAFSGASAHNIETSRTYPIMNGPNEFTVTGNLRDWNQAASLAHIRIPTLVLTSTLDEFSLDCAETLHRGIRGSKLVVLRSARHLAMVEQPNAYVAVLRSFLGTLR